MADDGGNTAQGRKRAAEAAAKVVLAKHPAVVAGTVRPATIQDEPAPLRPASMGDRNIARALRR